MLLLIACVRSEGHTEALSKPFPLLPPFAHLHVAMLRC